MAGRTVLVTGATSGIGRATAVYLSRLGARIVLSGRDEARLAESRSLLTGEGHSSYLFDLSDTAAIVPWLKSVCAEVGPLHGLAHCAGMQVTRALQAINADFVQDTLMQNLAACLMLAQAFRLKACHVAPASIVFVASTTALKAAPGNVAYAASKGGVIAMTRTLGLELIRDGVRVNAVAPGLIDTPMAQRFRDVTEYGFQKLVEMHPLGLGQADDVAAAIAFLLADTSRWITGATLAVDGGLLA